MRWGAVILSLPDNSERRLCELLKLEDYPEVYVEGEQNVLRRALGEIASLRGARLADFLAVGQPTGFQPAFRTLR